MKSWTTRPGVPPPPEDCEREMEVVIIHLPLHLGKRHPVVRSHHDARIVKFPDGLEARDHLTQLAVEPLGLEGVIETEDTENTEEQHFLDTPCKRC